MDMPANFYRGGAQVPMPYWCVLVVPSVKVAGAVVNVGICLVAADEANNGSLWADRLGDTKMVSRYSMCALRLCMKTWVSAKRKMPHHCQSGSFVVDREFRT